MSAVLFKTADDSGSAPIKQCAQKLRGVSGVTSTELWAGGPIDRSVHDVAAGAPAVYLLLNETNSISVFQDGAFGPALAEVSTSIMRRWQLEQIVPGDRASPADANGLILVSMNIERGHEQDFNAWYTTEHIPMLSRVAGVICARRFSALQGDPRYVALYHVTDTALYRHASWVAANQTPWIKRIYPLQRDPIHFMFSARA